MSDADVCNQQGLVLGLVKRTSITLLISDVGYESRTKVIQAH
jgi:hypothetical protein